MFINYLNTVHSTIKFTKEISPTEIPFLGLIIYIRESRLYTRLHTKTTERYTYLNFGSEHPMSLKKSKPYSQFIRLKRIHTEPQHLLEAQIHMYLFFLSRGYCHDTILKTWKQTNKVSREQWLSPIEASHDTKTLLMFITTYSRANPNFKELISKHWSYLGRSSATRELGKQDFMITYRKTPSLKDMLVRARITQPTTHFLKGVIDHILANLVEEYPNQGRLKTYTKIKPTIHWEVALTKAITLYTVCNAIGSTLKM